MNNDSAFGVFRGPILQCVCTDFKLAELLT